MSFKHTFFSVFLIILIPSYRLLLSGADLDENAQIIQILFPLSCSVEWGVHKVSCTYD